MQALKNKALKPDVRAELFDGKPAALAAYFDTLWSAAMQATEQDRLLVSLLTQQPDKEISDLYDEVEESF